jgi:hypothetical protein
MRKVLLASTALVAMSSVSAMAADVTISGSFETLYSMVDDDNITTDTDSLSASNDLDFSFSDTTDSGISMSYSAGFSSGAQDDSTLTIAADFGSIRVTTLDDDAVEGLDIDVDGYTPEEGRTTTPTYGGGFAATGGTSVSYTLPSLMDGLTVAVAMADGTADAKGTGYGVSYTGMSGDLSFTVAAASASVDNGTSETDQMHYGVSITTGAITVGVEINSADTTGSATAAENTANYESSGIGLSYVVSDALTLGGYSRTAETGTAAQKFEETAISAVYTIASGLTASLTSTTSSIDAGTVADGDSRVVIGLNASF